MKKLLKVLLPILAVFILFSGCNEPESSTSGTDTKPVTGVTVTFAGEQVDANSLVYLEEGGLATVAVSLLPAGISGTVTWTLSNNSEDYLEVDIAANGLSAALKGITEGTVTITLNARNRDNKSPVSFKFDVEIVPPGSLPVQTVIVKDGDFEIAEDAELELYIGDEITLSVDLRPAGVAGTITWSDGDTVVGIDPVGYGLTAVLTALTVGELTVTVSAENERNTNPVTRTFKIKVAEAAPAPTSWTERNWTPVDSMIFTVAYGNGLFVAGGNDGNILYATQDMVWNSSTTPLNAHVRGLAFGGGFFVAGVQAGGGHTNLHRSTDGISWIPMSSALGGTMCVASDGGNNFAAGGFFNAGQGRAWATNITPAAPIWRQITVETGEGAITGVTRGLAYGNGRLVAVGDGGNIAYSDDLGATWTAATGSKGTNSYEEVVFGRNKFVAVGGGGQMAYSFDGAEWTLISEENKGNLAGPISALTYARGYFAAADNSGRISYSKDGLNWIGVTSLGVNIQGLVFGGDKWVAVGANGRIFYSGGEDSVKYPLMNLTVSGSDGIGNIYNNRNVTVRQSNGDDFTVTLTAVIDPADKPLLNPVITWTSSVPAELVITPNGTDNLTATLKGLEIHDGYTVTVTATNDDTSTPLTLTFRVDVIDPAAARPVTEITVRYGDVIIPDGGTITLDVDQIRQLTVTPEPSDAAGIADYAVTWSSSASANVSVAATGSPAALTAGSTAGVSADITVSVANKDNTGPVTKTFTVNVLKPPKTWVNANLIEFGILGGGAQVVNGVAFGNNTWVIVGEAASDGVAAANTTTNGKVMYSNDGLIWNELPVLEASKFNFPVRFVTYGNGMFVAGGHTGQILVSQNGIDWVTKTSVTGSVLSLGFGGETGNTLVATTNGGNRVFHTNNSFSDADWAWTQPTATPAGMVNCRGVAYGNGTWVIGGDVIRYSTDLVTWENATIPASGTGATMKLAFGNNTFVGVMGNGAIVYSIDNGVNWQLATNAFGASANGVAYANGYFVAGANSNNIRYSSDGITWTVSGTAGAAIPSARLNGHLQDVAFGNDRWVVVGRGGNVASSDVAAIEVAPTFAVTFNANTTDTVTNLPERLTGINSGETITKPAVDPSRVGFRFDGWFKEEAGTNEWIFAPNAGADTVTGNTTLFAKWTASAINIKDGETVINNQPQFMTEGDIKTLTVDVLGAMDVSQVVVTWTSGNEEKVEFDNTTGTTVVLSALEETAEPITVTVSAVNFGTGADPITATFTVAVASAGALAPVTGITIRDVTVATVPVTVGNNGAITLFLNDVSNMTVALTPVPVTGDVTWSASNDGVTINDSDPFAVVLTAGTADRNTIITVSAENADNDTPVILTFTVNVRTPPAAFTQVTQDGITAHIQGAAFGNNVFVVAGNGGAVAYSTNGSTWTAGTSTVVGDFRGLSFANGMFFGNTVKSANGATWEASNITGLTATLTSVSYGDDTYVATDLFGSCVAISSDGLIWTNPTPVGTLRRGGTYGDGIFLAVGANIQYSTDRGATWETSDAVAGTYYDAAYGNGVYVAVGGTSARIYSFNGINWFSTGVSGGNLTGNINRVVFANGYFVAVDGNGAINYSANGITWRTSTGICATLGGGGGIAYNNGVWVVAGSSGRIMTSTVPTVIGD
jgi:uncharacterized repeat protein (TIGR02543 family)